MKLRNEIFDGKVTDAGQPLLTSSNRAFRYGDGIFETMKVSGGKPLFFQDHMERLRKGMQLLHLQWPSGKAEQDLENAIQQMVSLHNETNLRLRLTVFRNGTGYYKPETDHCSWHLCGEVLPTGSYPTSSDGLRAGLFRDELKTTNALSGVKSLNCLNYVLAGIAARDRGWDEAFLMNTEHRIIEATSSNIIFRKGNAFFTPPLSEGCLDGVMRKNVIRLLAKNGFEVMETPVKEAEAGDSDEILLTNVISGVRWIAFYNGKTYQNKFAATINQWLP